MDKGSSRPITAIAHDFTLQAGVPMVTEIVQPSARAERPGSA